MKRLPPSEKLSKEIEEILSGKIDKHKDLLEMLIERYITNSLSFEQYVVQYTS
jgi:hypothetical protein